MVKKEEFCLSEHRIEDKYAWDTGGYIYTEVYVKEFIRLLKEQQCLEKRGIGYCEKCLFCREIDNLAGEKLSGN